MKVVCRAYASSANVGPGFDVFGLAIDRFIDTIILKEDEKYFIVEGPYKDYVPNVLEDNLIGYILEKFSQMIGEKISLGIKLVKGIPPSLGLGSSGASSIAFSKALVNINKKIDSSISTILKLASLGEEFVSGSPHLDNISASLIGGFVIASKGYGPVRIDPPKWFKVILLIPSYIPFYKEKTKYARNIMPKCYNLDDIVFNIEHSSILIKGLLEGDMDLIKYGLRDLIAEPYRKNLVPNYDLITNELDKLPILGHYISGAGPTLAVLYSENNEDIIVSSIKDIISGHNLSYEYHICEIAGGAEVWLET